MSKVTLKFVGAELMMTAFWIPYSRGVGTDGERSCFPGWNERLPITQTVSKTLTKTGVNWTLVVLIP